MQRGPWDNQLEERLVRYCAIDTPSDSESTTVPSTECQWLLLRLLEQELRALGAARIELTPQGFLMASLPSTQTEAAPVVALLAHVDTTTQFNATGVRPIVHHNYDGADIILPADNTQVLNGTLFPYLAQKVGQDIVTASGNSLLGADDKAGVAILMTLAAHLLAHPEIPHGEVRLCFTPDEEIGTGVRHLPLDLLGAQVGYTLDGGELGVLGYETFSADKAKVVVTGVSIHPGSAKDKLVNALHLASQIILALPQSSRTPETTDGRQGFLHVLSFNGTAGRAELEFIVRDFELDGLQSHRELLEKVCAAVAAGEPRATVEVAFTKQYRNMRYWLEKDMHPVELAAEAYKKQGIEPRLEVMRGGTDGSQLTEMGLPTPNLFTGMQNVHGPLEWVSVQDMAQATGVCLELVQLWGKAPAREPAKIGSGQ